MTSRQRAYESPLRADQAELTRLRVLQAVSDLLGDPAVEEVTIPLVALRAQVSVRTIYRHFPTREDLFDAWGEWADERLKLPVYSYPHSADELADFARSLYASYDANEPVLRAILTSKAARALRERTRKKRQQTFERSMGGLVAGLTPEARLRAFAAVYLLVSAPGWAAMRDQWSLEGSEAGKAAAWAVGVLLDELRRNPKGIEDQGDRTDHSNEFRRAVHGKREHK